MNEKQIARKLGISEAEVRDLLASGARKLQHTPTRLYYQAKWKYQACN
jgi:DNA-directed RNA polymerase specialized sigma24 family protein